MSVCVWVCVWVNGHWEAHLWVCVYEIWEIFHKPVCFSSYWYISTGYMLTTRDEPHSKGTFIVSECLFVCVCVCVCVGVCAPGYCLQWIYCTFCHCPSIYISRETESEWKRKHCRSKHLLLQCIPPPLLSSLFRCHTPSPTHTDIYSALQKYCNSKDKIALLAVESRHLQIWLKDEYETKLQNVTFYYWVIQLIGVLPAKKFSTFRVSSPCLMWA